MCGQIYVVSLFHLISHSSSASLSQYAPPAASSWCFQTLTQKHTRPFGSFLQIWFKKKCWEFQKVWSQEFHFKRTRCCCEPCSTFTSFHWLFSFIICFPDTLHNWVNSHHNSQWRHPNLNMAFTSCTGWTWIALGSGALSCGVSASRNIYKKNNFLFILTQIMCWSKLSRWENNRSCTNWVKFGLRVRKQCTQNEYVNICGYILCPRGNTLALRLTQWQCVSNSKEEVWDRQRKKKTYRAASSHSWWVSLYVDFLYGQLSQRPLPVGDAGQGLSWSDLSCKHHSCLLLSVLLLESMELKEKNEDSVWCVVAFPWRLNGLASKSWSSRLQIV